MLLLSCFVSVFFFRFVFCLLSFHSSIVLYHFNLLAKKIMYLLVLFFSYSSYFPLCNVSTVFQIEFRLLILWNFFFCFCLPASVLALLEIFVISFLVSCGSHLIILLFIYYWLCKYLIVKWKILNIIFWKKLFSTKTIYNMSH